MKWIIPKDGQERVRKTFLWFPLKTKVYDEQKKIFLPLEECRWFEEVEICEIYQKHYNCWFVRCFIEENYEQPKE